ncbi:hypothetical protein CRG98_020402 [Punica granatum]|uniref:Uncharacterized protein n=1 Tax=Punica granatum TaxID=22663 RepID=A0A2I0JSG4_PUNGR|nr:hypothetical protein CRG98_020402 [Punica granatum]
MDSREPRGLTAFPLRGSAERCHSSFGSMSVSSPRIRDTSCYACMTIRYMDVNDKGKRILCTVGRPSDRDHRFTGEGEGCEEPFDRDGTTRQSRGKKWHVVGIRRARLGVLRPDYVFG